MGYITDFCDHFGWGMVIKYGVCIYIHLFSVLQIYRQMGEKYGVQYSEDEILNRYRRAYQRPWGRSRLRLDYISLTFC